MRPSFAGGSYKYQVGLDAQKDLDLFAEDCGGGDDLSAVGAVVGAGFVEDQAGGSDVPFLPGAGQADESVEAGGGAEA